MEDSNYDPGVAQDTGVADEPPQDYYWPENEFFFNQVNENTLICSILISIVGLVGLIGNSLMLRAWMKYPKLRNDFYTIFAAISLIDILFIVIGVPASIVEIMEVTEITTEAFCKASKYIMYASGFTSAYLFSALAALRAILLTNRNMIPRPRAKHIIVISLLTYILIFLLSIPIISIHTSHYSFCYFDASIQDNHTQVWLLESFSAFVPLFLVLLFYLVSFVLGKRYFADSYSPREKQKSRLVSCVVLAFIICQIPYRIVSIYENYIDNEDIDKLLQVLLAKDYLTCLLFVNKAIQPILCAKLTKDLGLAFDEIINCKKRTARAQTPSLQPELLPGSDTPIPPPPADTAADSDPEVDHDLEPPSPLVDTPSRSRPGVDRTISTTSTMSSNSHAPLIGRSVSSSPSEMEMM